MPPMDWQRFMALQALGNFGSGMMQAGQPSRMPQSFLGALGAGAGQASQGMSQMLPMMMQMQARQRTQGIAEAQESRAQGKYDRGEAQRSSYERMLGDMPQVQGSRPSPGFVGPMPGADSPQTAMLRGLGPKAGSGVLASIMGRKPQNQSPLARLMGERAALRPDDPMRGVYDAAIAKASTTSGMEITVPGPNGPITFRTGVRSGSQRPMSGAHRDKIVATGQTLDRSISAIDSITAAIGEDPSRAGLTGTVKGMVQTGLGMSKDMAAEFAGIVSDDIKRGLADADFAFDPELPKMQVLENMLAYALARANKPTGRLNKDDKDAALKNVRLHGLTSTADVLARLKAVRKRLTDARNDIGDRLPKSRGTPIQQGEKIRDYRRRLRGMSDEDVLKGLGLK